MPTSNLGYIRKICWQKKKAPPPAQKQKSIFKRKLSVQLWITCVSRLVTLITFCFSSLVFNSIYFYLFFASSASSPLFIILNISTPFLFNVAHFLPIFNNLLGQQKNINATNSNECLLLEAFTVLFLIFCSHITYNTGS